MLRIRCSYTVLQPAFDKRDRGIQGFVLVISPRRIAFKKRGGSSQGGKTEAIETSRKEMKTQTALVIFGAAGCFLIDAVSVRHNDSSESIGTSNAIRIALSVLHSIVGWNSSWASNSSSSYSDSCYRSKPGCQTIDYCSSLVAQTYRIRIDRHHRRCFRFGIRMDTDSHS